MKLLETLRISFTNLRSNKMRSFLTIMGIAIGIASIVFLVSLGYGLQKLSIDKIASIEAINTLDISPGKNSSNKVDDSLVDEFQSDTDIEKVSPLIAFGLKLDYEGKKTDAVGNFVNDDYSDLEGVEPVLGAFFSNSENQIVVSSALLKAINIEATNSVEKELSASIVFVDSETKNKTEVSKKYQIIGVIQDESTSFAYIPISSIEENLSGNTIYNSMKVKVADQEKIPQVKDKITSMGYTVTSIADTIDQVDQIFRIIQIILAFFGLVALLVASIGMFNTMTIALLERTRDIGVMKALGVRDRDVSRIFLVESAIIATSGGFLGVLLGWLTAKGINLIINILAQSVGGEPQNLFVLPLVFSSGIVIFSIFVGIATGFYPSKRASKLNPLDALRYE